MDTTVEYESPKHALETLGRIGEAKAKIKVFIAEAKQEKAEAQEHCANIELSVLAQFSDGANDKELGSNATKRKAKLQELYRNASGYTESQKVVAECTELLEQLDRDLSLVRTDYTHTNLTVEAIIANNRVYAEQMATARLEQESVI